MIRIAVCDDEQNFIDQIYTILLSGAKGISCAVHISTYAYSKALLYDVEEGIHFDLLFLDIEMPETDGMSLAAAVRSQLPLSLIVFITSHTQYAVKAYELSVFRYIPKSELEKYAVIVLAGEEISVRKSLEQVLKELGGQKKGEAFLLAERGYIVNLFHVERMEEQSLYLDDGTVIPVSRRNLNAVRDSIVSFWRGNL